jgi:hypothetical protein
MKIRAAALAATLLTAHSAANAWFFFFIPGSVINAVADGLSGAEGDHCVGEFAKAGDPIRIGSDQYVVKSVSGKSSRCSNPQMPVRAKLEAAPAPTITAAPAPIPVAFKNQHCLSGAFKVGDVHWVGNVNARITAIEQDSRHCGGLAPHLATSEPFAEPTIQPVAATEAPAPAPAGASNASQRLRELSGLLKDGLITQDDYDAKKAEVLKAF